MSQSDLQTKTKLSKFMGGLAQAILDNQIKAIAAMAVVVTILSSGLLRLGFDVSPESFFLDGAPIVEDWYSFKDKYQSDEFSFVVVTPPQEAAAGVETIRQLTATFADLDGVERVTSLTNVRSISSDGDFIDVGEYLRDDLTDQQVVERLAAAPSHPYYGGLFVNQDVSKFGILIETESNFSNADKAGFTSSIRDILADDLYAEWDGIAIGAPILDTDVQTIVTIESAIFGTITYVLVMVGFYVAFRNRIALVLPTVVSTLAIMSALGAMGLWGSDMGLLTPIVPSFLISVGLGTSVYLLSDFNQERQNGAPVTESIIQTMERAGGPALLANLTTAGALFAFSGSRVLPVRDVGLTLGIGLVMACAITFVLFPIFAAKWGEQVTPKASKNTENATLTKLANFSLAKPGLIVSGFVGIIIVALLGVAKLDTDYFYLGTFKTSSRMFVENETANDAIPVSNSIEVLVTLDQIDSFKEPAALVALETVVASALSEVDSGVPVKTYALSDVVKEISNEALGVYEIPGDRSTVAQMILLFESSGHDELSRVSNADFNEARLTFLVPSRPYSAYTPLVEYIQNDAAAIFQDAGYETVTVSVTGVVPMWMEISSFLTETQIQSFMIAAVVVAFVMILIAQSLTIGLMMAAINIGCVTLVLGFMGHWGVVLDPFTILVGAIALGILDDDTIHFARSFLDRKQSGQAMDVALHNTFQSAGRAMGLQSLVLIIAFVVYTTGSVQSLATFGTITCMTILLGLIVEYTVTPAMLVLVTRGKEMKKAEKSLPRADLGLYRPALGAKSFAPKKIVSGE